MPQSTLPPGMLHAPELSGFHRARRPPSATLRPLVITSIPAAFIGGLIPLRERHFVILMAGGLFLAGLRFVLGHRLQHERAAARVPEGRSRQALLMGVGAGIGLLAGMTGIGGGIYSGPILLLTGISDLRATPAITSAFVASNSPSGLIAHLTRLEHDPALWIPLACAVVLGGVGGSAISVRWLSAARLRRMLGLVLITAVVVNGAKAL